jgi:hypothetical protein
MTAHLDHGLSEASSERRPEHLIKVGTLFYLQILWLCLQTSQQGSTQTQLILLKVFHAIILYNLQFIQIDKPLSAYHTSQIIGDAYYGAGVLGFFEDVDDVDSSKVPGSVFYDDYAGFLQNGSNECYFSA